MDTDKYFSASLGSYFLFQSPKIVRSSESVETDKYFSASLGSYFLFQSPKIVRSGESAEKGIFQYGTPRQCFDLFVFSQNFLH